MATDEPSSHLAESGVTMHSDSEQYSAGEEVSTSPESSSSSTPMILYQPPTIWGLVRGTAINLLLPFINGMMLGFGELFAHEAAFRLGWSGTKVRIHDACSASSRLIGAVLVPGGGSHSVGEGTDKKLQVFPLSRRTAHPIGPGVEIREKSRRPGPGLSDLTSME
ncbi:mitochondrial import protein 1 [Seiridium cupressi]